MKHLFLVSLLLISVSTCAYSQPIKDFETVVQNYFWAIFATGTNESTLYSFVPILSLSFIYTSSQYEKLIILPISNTWAVTITDSIDSITLISNSSTIVKVIVYKDDINNFILKNEVSDYLQC